MTTFLVAYLVHAFRVMPAAAAMVVIALPLWFINGVVGRALRIQAPAFVLISSGLIAAAAFSIGGYISATRLTPGSILHPSIAAMALALIYNVLSGKGEAFLLNVVLITLPMSLAAAGAALASNRRTA